jgi:NAD(P)H-dependent FMN reductase
MSKILAFAGSGRKESFNKKLVKIAALGAQEAGANVNIQWHIAIFHNQENWDLYFSPDGGAN